MVENYAAVKNKDTEVNCTKSYSGYIWIEKVDYKIVSRLWSLWGE